MYTATWPSFLAASMVFSHSTCQAGFACAPDAWVIAHHKNKTTTAQLSNNCNKRFTLISTLRMFPILSLSLAENSELCACSPLLKSMAMEDGSLGAPVWTA